MPKRRQSYIGEMSEPTLRVIHDMGLIDSFQAGLKRSCRGPKGKGVSPWNDEAVAKKGHLCLDRGI